MYAMGMTGYTNITIRHLLLDSMEISHGMCKDCYKKVTGKEPPKKVNYKKGLKVVCSWCKKVLQKADD